VIAIAEKIIPISGHFFPKKNISFKNISFK